MQASHPKNTIIAENSAAGLGPDCSDNLSSEGCNLVGDGSDCTITSNSGDQIGTFSDPIDPRLGPLQDNGGPTDTHALLFGGPAINAVSWDCGCTTRYGDPVLEDQRGAPRPGSVLCDIGAYEVQPPPTRPEPEEGDVDVAVGGQVEPIDFTELDTAAGQQPGGESTQTSIALSIALVSGLAIVGGFLALRRRRAH